MKGTLLNVATVLAGTAIGSAVGRHLSEKVRRAIMSAIGLFTLALGVHDASGAFDELWLSLVVLGSLALGYVTGSMLDLERRIAGLGETMRKRMHGRERGFVEGFLTATILFCTGPLAVLGSLDDGLRGDIGLLAVKSSLDGLASVFLTASFGWGVGAAAFSVLVYQGALTLGAGLLEPLMTAAVTASLEAVGGLLIMGIGLKLLDVRDLAIGNALPAIFWAPAITWGLERAGVI